MTKVVCLIVVLGFAVNVFSQKEKFPSKDEKQNSSFFNKPVDKSQPVIDFYEQVCGDPLEISSGWGLTTRNRRNFRDSLDILIGKFVGKNLVSPKSEMRNSRIAFIDYDSKEQKLSVIKTDDVSFKECVERAIKTEKVLSLVKDSASSGFILPVFLRVFNDALPGFRETDLILSSQVIGNMFSLLKEEKRKQVLDPIIIFTGGEMKIVR